MSSAFNSEAMADFFYRVIELTNTFNTFLKAFSLSILLLSKLKSIPKKL